jgi:hypothetical protein
VIKISKCVIKKIALINTSVPVSGRKRIQARHRNYNKNNDEVNWERNSRLGVDCL